jgi:hypothetical protein
MADCNALVDNGLQHFQNSEKPYIVLLSGQKGSGKSTAAKILVEKYQFVELSFASTLKDILSIIYGWDREKLEGKTPQDRVWRETKDEFWSEFYGETVTPRSELQRMGTNVFREHVHKDIWVGIVCKKIANILFNPTDTIEVSGTIVHRDYVAGIVISDARFLNELTIIPKYFVTKTNIVTLFIDGYKDLERIMLVKRIILTMISIYAVNKNQKVDSEFIKVMETLYPKEHVSEWECLWIQISKPHIFNKVINNNFPNNPPGQLERDIIQGIITPNRPLLL